jgi:hypothetical protein
MVSDLDGIASVDRLTVGNVIQAYKSALDCMPGLTELTMLSNDLRFVEEGFFNYTKILIDVSRVSPCEALPSPYRGTCQDTVTTAMPDPPRLPAAATQSGWFPIAEEHGSVGMYVGLGISVIAALVSAVLAVRVAIAGCKMSCAHWDCSIGGRATRATTAQSGEQHLNSGQMESTV